MLAKEESEGWGFTGQNRKGDQEDSSVSKNTTHSNLFDNDDVHQYFQHSYHEMGSGDRIAQINLSNR